MLPPYAASQVVAPAAKSVQLLLEIFAFHEAMFWLKATAFLNMLAMVVTLLVSDQARDWPPLLKAVAPSNIPPMVVTAPVFHELIS